MNPVLASLPSLWSVDHEAWGRTSRPAGAPAWSPFLPPDIQRSPPGWSWPPLLRLRPACIPPSLQPRVARLAGSPVSARTLSSAGLSFSPRILPRLVLLSTVLMSVAWKVEEAAGQKERTSFKASRQSSCAARARTRELRFLVRSVPSSQVSWAFFAPGGGGAGRPCLAWPGQHLLRDRPPRCSRARMLTARPAHG